MKKFAGETKEGEGGHHGEEEEDHRHAVTVPLSAFVELITDKQNERDDVYEHEKAFELFSGGRSATQGFLGIAYPDLKKVSLTLGEKMSEKDLKAMIFEVNKIDPDGHVPR